ncbi:hypothetical protein NXW00_15795 [Bacteroides thetaiotaomicron]|nr:hypothetical protein [Bacteroides thetaiotaomicron]
MWNPRKKTSRPEYSYAPIGSRWVVYHWVETGSISTADKVAEFPTSEEARKECYRLNGWKYEEPEKRKNNLKY